MVDRDALTIVPELAVGLLIAVMALGFGCTRPDTHRTVAPRFTASDSYQPCPTPAGNIATGICRQADLLPSSSRLFRKPASQTEEFLWVARRLAVGDRRAESALRALRRDVLTGRPSPRTLSDLGALELVLADSLDRPSQLIKALESIDRTLAAEPGTEAAVFNKGLAFEALGLRQQAISAWTDYLDLDGSSGWSGEARRRRARLQAMATERRHREDSPMAIQRIVEERDASSVAILTGHQESMWAYVFSSGLTPWATAAIEQRDIAGGELLLMAWLGRQLTAASGDVTLEDITEHLAAAGGADLGAYARSVLVYAELRRGQPYSECNAQLEQVERTFRQLDSPLRLWVSVDRAICDFFRKDFEASLRRLAEVREIAGEQGYRWLTGRASWIEGLVTLRQGDLERSLDSLSSSRETLRATGDLASSAYLDSLIAKNLQHVGRKEGSWAHRIRALRAADAMTPERRFTVYEEVAELLEQTRSSAGMYFALAQLRAAEDAARRNPELGDLPIFALLKLATLERRNGSVGSIQQWVRPARGRFDALGASNPNRGRIARALRVHEALVDGDAEAMQEALQSGEQALGGTESNPGDRLELTRLARLRGSALERAGNVEQATRVYASVFSEAERQRSLLTDLELRAKSFAFLREVNEDLVLALIASGEVERALCAANRLRYSTSTHRPSGAPPACSKLLASLPRPIVLTASLTEKLVLFLVEEGQVVVETRPVPRSDLVQLAADFTKSLWDGSSDADALAAELGRLLLPDRLVEAGLPTELILCPDAELAAFPFSALKLDDGRNLIDETAVSVALWLDGTHASQAKDAASGIVLLGDPAVDPSRGNYPRLPGAANEVDALNRIYHTAGWTSTIVEREDATEAAFRAALVRADILHYAGHSIAVAADPFQSAIVLSAGVGPSTLDDGLLTVKEVAELELDGPRVVVLSSCDSAVGVEPESADIVSLGGSLRGAGIPSVVASLWPLSDRDTTVLQIRFHHALADGLAPALALARAQRQARQLGLGTHVWASLAVFRAV